MLQGGADVDHTCLRLLFYWADSRPERPEVSDEGLLDSIVAMAPKSSHIEPSRIAFSGLKARLPYRDDSPPSPITRNPVLVSPIRRLTLKTWNWTSASSSQRENIKEICHNKLLVQMSVLCIEEGPTRNTCLSTGQVIIDRRPSDTSEKRSARVCVLKHHDLKHSILCAGPSTGRPACRS
jgi:hypothetical protein